MVRFTTAGESHGQGLVIILEGVPAGLPISEDYIGVHLARRQKGYGRGGRMLIEQDRAKIISGVRHGHTLGSPIGMTLENKDWANWEEAMAVDPLEGEPQSPRTQRITRLRPGHADLPGTMKYGFEDVRNVLERASARETAARVAAGAIAIKLLEEFGIEIHSHVLSIGSVKAEVPENIDWAAVEESPVRCADPAAAISGVVFPWAASRTSAPLSARTLMIWASPESAARKSGVWPVLPWARASGPSGSLLVV